jgi:hypothetical protein
MSYSKQTWVTGDIVTAEKLNHMEDGIAELPYDIVIKLDDYVSNYPADEKIHLVKGSWNDIVYKMTNRLPINAYVYYADTVNTDIYSYMTDIHGMLGSTDQLEIGVYDYVQEGGDVPSYTLDLYLFLLTESGLTMSRPTNNDNSIALE